MIVILLLLLALFITAVTGFLFASVPLARLTPYALESDGFRAMRLGESVSALDQLDPEQLAALMIQHNYDLTECTDLSYDNKILEMKKPRAYQKLADGYRTVLSDLAYFPVPASIRPDTPRPVYEDGWQQKRTYGREENTVGNFPVHLHLGIYIQTEHFKELSVNPYWILRYLEKRTLLYDY